MFGLIAASSKLKTHLNFTSYPYHGQKTYSEDENPVL